MPTADTSRQRFPNPSELQALIEECDRTSELVALVRDKTVELGARVDELRPNWPKTVIRRHHG